MVNIDNRIESNRIESNRIESNRIESNRIESNRIESNRIESGRIEYIDALRAVAAISVLVVHIVGYLSRLPDALWFFQFVRLNILAHFDLGLFGVALFFYISGFVVPVSLVKGGDVAQFWFYRLVRLYPLYWISLVLVFFVDQIFLGKIFSLSQVLANVSMAPQLFGEKPMSGVYWTLFVELLFYVVVTILFLLGLLRHVWFISALILFLVALTAIPVVFNSFLGLSLLVTFLPFHLSFLFSGYLVRVLVHDSKAPRYQFLFVILLAQLGLSLLATDAFFDGIRFGLFSNHANFFAYFFATIVFLWSVKRRTPNGALLLRIGRSSFSLYLLHWPLIVMIIGAFSYIQNQYVFLVLIFGGLLSLVVSEVSYLIFERYFIVAGKRWWSRLAR